MHVPTWYSNTRTHSWPLCAFSGQLQLSPTIWIIYFNFDMFKIIWNVLFQSQAIHTNLYASSWFLTLFATSLPLPIACRYEQIYQWEAYQNLTVWRDWLFGSLHNVEVTLWSLTECRWLVDWEIWVINGINCLMLKYFIKENLNHGQCQFTLRRQFLLRPIAF